LQGGGHRFDPDTLHFFRRCANRGSVEVVAGQDLVLAVDLEFGDKLADEGFGFLRFAGGEERLKLVGDVGEVGSRGGSCRRVWAREGEFGVLGVEVVEPGLEPREPDFAAFRRELACSKAS
jgi:hypothetical protein